MHERSQKMLTCRRECRVFKGWNTDIKDVLRCEFVIFHGVQTRLHGIHGGRNDQPLTKVFGGNTVKVWQSRERDVQLSSARAGTVLLDTTCLSGFDVAVP